MGEQWSPQTAPAMQAEIEMIISSGLVFWNTPTTMGIRIPKVPQEVPVAKASRQPTRKIMAGRKFSRPLAWLYTRSATYTSAPRLSVMAFKVQAKVRIRMAGTMALKPSGIQAMQSWKSRTRRTWYRTRVIRRPKKLPRVSPRDALLSEKAVTKSTPEKNPPVYSIPITQQIIKEIIGIRRSMTVPLEITDGSDSSA